MWRFIKEKKPKYNSVISPQQHITPLHWFSMSNKFFKEYEQYGILISPLKH